jgi:hypothetical protein
MAVSDSDWWADPVILALDFTAHVDCDLCRPVHPADWHCLLNCGCSIFVCNKFLIYLCMVFHEDDEPCPWCDASAAYVQRGRPI